MTYAFRIEPEHYISFVLNCRIVSSPEACQGLDASSEVCDVDEVQPTQSIRLIAQDGSIRSEHLSWIVCLELVSSLVLEIS